MAKQWWKPGNILNPVPAVMVSVTDGMGKNNIITVAWAGTVCTNPPMVSVSIRPERYSYPMIQRTKEFVINLTTKELVRACDYCGVTSGRDVDKFQEMNLTPFAMREVIAPGIAESPVSIGCKVRDIVELGSHSMFLADVVEVAVEDTYLDEHGKFLLNEQGLLMYSHGEYFALGEKLGKFGYSIKKDR